MHGPPSFRGERQFFLRRTSDQEHAVLHLAEPDGLERVLIDPMQLNPDGTTTLDAYHPSPNGALLAYQLSEGGTEESSIRVMDVTTGGIVDGPIPRTRFSPVSWTPDSASFYYVRQLPAEDVPAGEEQYHRRVWLHRLGQPDADDRIVFGDGQDKAVVFGCSLSRDGRWLVVSGSKGTDPRNDIWIADVSDGNLEAPAFAVVQVGEDTQAGLRVGDDGRLYVWTDRDAPRGRLCVADPAAPAPEQWVTLVEERPDAVLEGFAIVEEVETPQLLCLWSEHAVSRISVHRLQDGERLRDLELPGLGSVGGLVERYGGGHEVWFPYTDDVTPMSVYRYDALTGETDVWARPPGSVDVDPGITTRLVEYHSYDGTLVRMFITARGDAALGPRPTILYGYGGFGISMTPGYSGSVLAWVEAGGVYAVACLRGGGEEGERWHRDGMLANKQRVFDDLHAAAEYLVEERWTTSPQLGISGGSNGGLLVGAALTQRPDLYRSVVCSAPLLDMVRYERRGLGHFWAGEYGTVDDPSELKTLLTYSPYHRVREGTAYPATLFTVFGSDTRVDPLHARKMCAALQHATSADPGRSPVLIRVESEVGHGARSVSRSIALAADVLGFQAWATGLAGS
jgi:prolyl oligopeptidase